MNEAIEKQVRMLLESEDSGHGMDHIQRVRRLTAKICEKTGADLQIADCIALLHDVDDYKIVGSQNAASLSNAKRILDLAHIDSEKQNAVLSQLSRIGFSKSLQGIRPDTLEGMAVSDADLLDAAGVHGIIRAWSYSIKMKEPFFDPQCKPHMHRSYEDYTSQPNGSSINHLFEKSLQLRDCMQTQPGKKMAAKRHQSVVNFLKAYFEEEDAADWLDILKEYA